MLCLMAVDTPEEEAFITKLYSEYEQMMYKIAFNVLKNKYDAEDTVHEAFLNIIRQDQLANLNKLQRSRLKAYLIITVKNTAYKCYNSRRSRIAENIEDLYSLKGGASAEEELFSEYEAENLHKALNKLLPNDYDLLFLSAVMGYSIPRMAERLEISENALRQRMFRARQRLKKLMNEEETVNDRR